MSFNEVIAELPRLTCEERQILIRRALELDDPPLSPADEALVEARLAEHHADPTSSIPLDELKRQLRNSILLCEARPHAIISPHAIQLEISAFDRGVRPVMKIVLPEKAEEVVEFRADPELQARIEELARKSTKGELTEAERAEYAGYARANKFIAILQRQARKIISSRTYECYRVRFVQK